MKPGPKHPYAVTTPSGIAYVRGKPQALLKAREMVGAMPQVTERDLEKFWGTVIGRTSEAHARRHGI
jgi:hypothetical protein